MNKFIKNFTLVNEKKVSWTFHNEKMEMEFKLPVEAYYVSHRDEILVLTDVDEFGSENLLILSGDGGIRLKSKMPDLEKPAFGVYSIWFVDGSDTQEVILNSEMFSPYDTGCLMDLETGVFSDFHPSK